MVKQAVIAAAPPDGAVGQATQCQLPSMTVQIYTDSRQSAEVERFLADNGVTTVSSEDCGNECTLFSAEVPASLLQALSHQTGVLFLDTIDRYREKLDEHLDLIVAQYDAGLITEAEAVSMSHLPYWNERILVVAEFDNSANGHKAIRYMEDNGVYIKPHPAGSMGFVGLIPVYPCCCLCRSNLEPS